MVTLELGKEKNITPQFLFSNWFNNNGGGEGISNEQHAPHFGWKLSYFYCFRALKNLKGKSFQKVSCFSYPSQTFHEALIIFYSRNCFTVIMNAAAKVYGISSLESMVGFISGILRDKTMADKLMYMPNNKKSKLPLL